MAHRAKLLVAYLGDGFEGWQRQPDRRTVQGELERALDRVTGGGHGGTFGAGRTDSGVHAAGQVAHVDLMVPIPLDRLHEALNHVLARDLRVRAVRHVPATFHARYSACAKVYRYRLRWTEPSLPWVGLRAATVPAVTEHDELLAALATLVGRHDMASFSVPSAAPDSTTRTLFDASAIGSASGIDLVFVGDGFLRYQVRRMVGALLDVGRGRRSVAGFRDLLDRPRAGSPLETAPARGLTLERVLYRATGRLESMTMGRAGLDE